MAGMGSWSRAGQLTVWVAVVAVAAVVTTYAVASANSFSLAQLPSTGNLASALQAEENQIRTYVTASPHHGRDVTHRHQEAARRMHDQHRAGLLSQIEADADSQLAEAKKDKQMQGIPSALQALKHAALQQLKTAPASVQRAAPKPVDYILRDDGVKVPAGNRGRVLGRAASGLTNKERSFVQDSLSNPTPLPHNSAGTKVANSIAAITRTAHHASTSDAKPTHKLNGVVWPGEQGHVSAPGTDKEEEKEEEKEKQGEEGDFFSWPHDADDAHEEGKEKEEEGGEEEDGKQQSSPFKEGSGSEPRHDSGDGLDWPTEGDHPPTPRSTGDHDEEEEQSGNASPFHDEGHKAGGGGKGEPGESHSEEEEEEKKDEEGGPEPVGSDDGLAWPDGQEIPVRKEPSTEDQWHGPGTEWSWPQVPKQEWDGVPSKLELVLLLEGVTSSSLSATDTRIVRAAVAQIAPLSIGQVEEDYAVNVPGLAGHVEMAMHLLLPPSIQCSAMEEHLRSAFEEDTVQSALSSFGLSAVSASLLGLSGCPTPDLPKPDYAMEVTRQQPSLHAQPLMMKHERAPVEDGHSAQEEEKTEASSEPGTMAAAYVAHRREHGVGEDQEEAVDAARQVATQTAQQVASQVATAAARQTALRLEDELRAIAAKVAKRAVRGEGREGRDKDKASALTALLRADRREGAAKVLQ